jgi:uncharacterized protein YjbI with pentapeptide repeats
VNHVPPIAIAPAPWVAAGAVAWRHRGTLRVTVIVQATAALVPGGVSYLIAPEPLNDSARSDELAPRAHGAGIVVSGHATAPRGRPAPAMSVRLAVLRDLPLLDKTLHVIGDRSGPGGPPAAFARIPLVYERSYGGRACPENPVGTGADGGRAPNVVHPEDPRRPASFDAVPASWQARRRWLGAHAAAVEATLARGGPVLDLPDTIDFRYFQPAPEDQVLSTLHGDEWIGLDGVDADVQRLQTRLPGVRARVLRRVDGATPSLLVSELALVAIDADRRRCRLIWRASFTAPNADALASSRVEASIEAGGEAPSASPPTQPAGEPRSSRAHARTALVDFAAIVGDLPFVKPEGTAVEAPRAVAATQAPRTHTGTAPSADIERAAAALPFTRPRCTSEPPRVRTTGPVDRAALEAAATPFAGAKAAPAVAPTMDRPVAPAIEAKAAPSGAAGVRAEVLARLADGQALIGLSLAGADLGGIDLAGRSLSGLDLRGANLHRANLARARLAGARLEDADLREAVLTEADLARADLCRATVAGARLDGADLTDANLTGARGEGACFARARGPRARFVKGRWDGAAFDDASLVEADFSGAALTRASFERADLSDARLGDARASEAVFDGARLPRARAEGVVLTNASLRAIDAPDLVAERAALSGATLTAARLPRARLAGATCERASFGGADLTGAHLGRVIADGAQFQKARLEGADLRNARAIGACFDGAQLARAHASRAELSQARFRGADLTGATLRPSRLCGADLARAKLDGADLRDADLTGAILSGASRDGIRTSGARMRDIVDRETPT